MANAKIICRLLDERLAKDIHLISQPQLHSICDYTIISTATSKPHLDALEYRLRQELKAIGILSGKPTEGKGSDSWRVVDAGFAIIHLMNEESRRRYNLETLWSEGKAISWNHRKKIRKLKKPSQRKTSRSRQ